MAKATPIQWCDSTVNPIMGCGGCELFPQPQQILSRIDTAVSQIAGSNWEQGRAADFANAALNDAWEDLSDNVDTNISGHVNDVTTTNLSHLRATIEKSIAKSVNVAAGKAALQVIEGAVTCYAATLHLNRGTNIEKGSRKGHRGYAPTFEQVTPFEGRVKAAARYSDLTGTTRQNRPWLDGLPRLIFVSDMGDAFTERAHFDFLKGEMAYITGDEGRRHLWLWLTKRPSNMRKFADQMGGLANNVCAMTTVTSEANLSRVGQLRDVQCSLRGLSIEPMWSPLADKIDLEGIDWVIVGGESGKSSAVAEFPVEWALDLRDRCLERNVAFFCKQLGRRPTRDGSPINLKNLHGGDWSEWDDDLKVREFPAAFHHYQAV